MSSEETPRLSRSIEDYLKAIYGLNEEGEAAATSDIADSLSVQPASVSGMIKRLADLDLLEHLPYRGVRLTRTGRREALRIIRRHRILETYLQVRLGYSWEDVHDEAERLEHAASDRLIDQMAAALHDPSHDPHGAPIPSRSGEIESVDHASLADVEPGTTVQIRAVRDDDSGRLRYMEAKGLLPGVEVTVESREPFSGPVTVRVPAADGGVDSRIIGFELASRIFVAAEEDATDEDATRG